MTPTDKYVIGLDYGTDSVRAVLANAFDGTELATSVFEYPRWKQGLYCDASKNQFRQHPLDYVEGLTTTIKDCVKQVGASVAANVLAISIDTTGSTPAVVDQRGIPLALLPGFENNPNAMFVLWKDHTAIQEAETINQVSKTYTTDYTQYCGGIYSSEWFWAKLLHLLRTDEAVRQAAFSCVEHSDWMPFLLTGGEDALQIKRNVCAAGHKGLWAAELGGFPTDEFFCKIDPLLGGFVNKLNGNLYTVQDAAGTLSEEWALNLGLTTQVKVGIGALDAHVGAIGGQIEEGYLLKVMGTSTCDMMVASRDVMNGKLIGGISGQVQGSIIPGMIGLEAGQAAFGDIYAWFKSLLLWPLQFIDDLEIKENISDNLLQALNREAKKISDDENRELAIDWMNGRRTPDNNPLLKGAIAGLTLGSDAPRIFKALVEATCFGSKRIADRIQEEGVTINGIIAVGGIAKKSPYVMQMLADVLETPIKIHQSLQTCAMGACMMAATVAGVHPTIETAMKQMGAGFEESYTPDKTKARVLQKRYKNYLELGGFIEKELG